MSGYCQAMSVKPKDLVFLAKKKVPKLCDGKYPEEVSNIIRAGWVGGMCIWSLTFTREITAQTTNFRQITSVDGWEECVSWV